MVSLTGQFQYQFPLAKMFVTIINRQEMAEAQEQKSAHQILKP
jgi:hypothetical protein